MQKSEGKENKRWFRAAFYGILFLLLGVSFVETEYVQKKFFNPLLYEREIKEYAERNNIPASLVASVIKNESRFVASAVSKSGAIGLMQIMPETGIWIAQQMGWAGFKQNLINEPAVNIRLGCWYLSELKHEFKREETALAAYNAGRGQVREWLENGRWDGVKVQNIPFDETRKYVQNVLEDKRKYEKLYGELR